MIAVLYQPIYIGKYFKYIYNQIDHLFSANSTTLYYYDPYAIMYTGTLPTSLFMSDTLFTIFIIVERFYAIYFPVKFYVSKKAIRIIRGMDYFGNFDYWFMYLFHKNGSIRTSTWMYSISCYVSSQAIYLYVLIDMAVITIS